MTGTTIDPNLTAREVLEAISEVISLKPSHAALGHYPSLRIQTNNLNTALADADTTVGSVFKEWSFRISSGSEVQSLYRLGEELHGYSNIAPALAQNVSSVGRYLLAETSAAAFADLELAARSSPDFGSFLKLGTFVRQFTDALIETSYQLAFPNPAELNYKFLESVVSFARIAPTSLHQPLYSEALQRAVTAFETLSRTQRRRGSSFTQLAKPQVVERIDELAVVLNAPERAARDLKATFHFSSDFAHVGFASALVMGANSPSIIIGGPGDAFTARAENLAELKLELLTRCAMAYRDFYIPALMRFFASSLGGSASSFSATLVSSQERLTERLGFVGRRALHPIRTSSIAVVGPVRIECMACDAVFSVQPPDHGWDSYCRGCGTQIMLSPAPEDADYAISYVGIGDVQGSSAVPFEKLDQNNRAKLKGLLKRLKPELTATRDKIAFAFVRGEF